MMIRMTRNWVLLLVLFCAGCGSLVDSRSFMHSEADFSFYQKVGVLPFASQSDDRLAGEKVVEHFLTELLLGTEMEVMDPGQFTAVIAQVLRSGPAGSGELSPKELTQIADMAGVQGIFKGIVHEYRMLSLGGEQYPVIAMTVKFIDAPTGTVVWQSNVTARGGPNLPIVSVGETYLLSELSQKVCRKVVKDFSRKAYSD